MVALRLTYVSTWQVIVGDAVALNRGEEQSRDITVMYVSENGGMLFGNVTCTVEQIEYFVQDPANLQNYNRYAYVLNNPLKYTDPSGEFFWVPVIIGAVIGTYIGGTLANDDYNPENWDYSSGKTWGYMLGGAIVGGISGYVGAAIAASEVPMANTLGIAGASFTNSIGTHIYTGGQTDISVSFGVGSYNFTTDEWNGIWNWNDLTTAEKIGYGVGALANLHDINNLINQENATLYTQVKNRDGSKDLISHTAIVDDETGNSLMSFGPNDEKIGYGGFKDQIGVVKPLGGYKKFAIAIRKGTPDYPVHVNLSKSLSLVVNKYLFNGLRVTSKMIPYQGVTFNCVNVSSIGLWLNGIPNIGIHPWLFHGYMQLYTMGMKPELFSYYLTNKYY